jgi:hypothetical protein
VSFGAPRPADRARGHNVAISLIGQLRGTAKTLDDLLAPAYAIAKPQQAMIWGEAPYWAAQKMLEEDDPPPYTTIACTTQIGFLPHRCAIAARTARRTASAIASGSRRRGFGICSTVSSAAS